MKVAEEIDESWHPIVNLLYQEPLNTLSQKVLPNISYQPARENIFRAFKMSINEIKLVIIGQDPYPRPGDAVGYSFAINRGRKFPVSLRNIAKEVIDSDFENVNPSGEIDLFSWVDQGVLLLNTALTVETGKAGSHVKYWEYFTQRVVSEISLRNPCVWLLWGKKAQALIPYINSNPFHVKGYDKTTIENIPINNEWNYIISAPHPAAEAYAGGKAGFFGSNCFYYTNRVLDKKRLPKIIW